MQIGTLLSLLQSVVVTRRLTEMALLLGILQAIIACWLKTRIAAAAMAPSVLVVAKVLLNLLYASQEDPWGISTIEVPFFCYKSFDFVCYSLVEL